MNFSKFVLEIGQKCLNFLGISPNAPSFSIEYLDIVVRTSKKYTKRRVAEAYSLPHEKMVLFFFFLLQFILQMSKGFSFEFGAGSSKTLIYIFINF